MYLKPPLSPIPVQCPYQIVGVDVLDLLVTDSGNHHVAVFQGYITKRPLVFPVPDQKAVRLYYQVADRRGHPHFGVPEALLPDRGTNLMSTLMLNV